jgi:hypothetical protein
VRGFWVIDPGWWVEATPAHGLYLRSVLSSPSYLLPSSKNYDFRLLAPSLPVIGCRRPHRPHTPSATCIRHSSPEGRVVILHVISDYTCEDGRWDQDGLGVRRFLHRARYNKPLKVPPLFHTPNSRHKPPPHDTFFLPIVHPSSLLFPYSVRVSHPTTRETPWTSYLIYQPSS